MFKDMERVILEASLRIIVGGDFAAFTVHNRCRILEGVRVSGWRGGLRCVVNVCCPPLQRCAPH